jgi:hypothetical protein
MTAQIGDRLRLDGQSYSLATCPALPWHHARLVKLTEKEAAPESRLLIFSTACWRRYVADWSIHDDRLYLEKIDGLYRLDCEAPLFADWVTETLRVPQGKMLSYVHMGFGSIFERDVFLNVRMGVVESRHEVSNKAATELEALFRGGEHLPSIDTVTPGLGGKRNS